MIDRPQVEIKGWVAFDQPFPESELRITMQDAEHSVVLSIEHRDDVSSAFPDLYCRGFCQLVDLDEFSPVPSTLTLKIEYPGGVGEIELSLKFTDAISKKSSYFKLNPNEHSDHAAPGMTQEQKDFWDKNGYLVIPGFYSAEQVSDINAHIELLWQHRKELNCPITVDEYIGTDRKKRSLFNQASESIREQPYKINDLYLASAEIRDLVLNPEIAQMLSALMYAGDPMICSSLYFEKGSQQEKHFDTFFMAPLIRDRMLATWIALEDVTEDNGPLIYYPGSHRIAPYRFENGRFNLNPSEKSDCYEYIDAELEKRKIEQEYFLAKKGDLFIWHAQLLHGGASIRDPESTRRSLVTHYFCRQDHNAAECEEFSSGMFSLKREYLKPGDFDEESHQYV